jgi:hypothetical protein
MFCAFTLVHTVVRCVLLINVCVSYMPSDTTVIHHQIGENRDSSADRQHETAQSDTINSPRTQANQKSMSEIRDLLQQCNSYSKNVNRLIITV